MIDQAKAILKEAERQGAVGIMVPVDGLRYLLGEVERLKGAAKEGWDIANELSHQVSGQQEEIEELQKALERIKAEDETPTRYFSYEMFYQAVMLVVDEALERTKP